MGAWRVNIQNLTTKFSCQILSTPYSAFQNSQFVFGKLKYTGYHTMKKIIKKNRPAAHIVITESVFVKNCRRIHI